MINPVICLFIFLVIVVALTFLNILLLFVDHQHVFFFYPNPKIISSLLAMCFAKTVTSKFFL